MPDHLRSAAGLCEATKPTAKIIPVTRASPFTKTDSPEKLLMPRTSEVCFEPKKVKGFFEKVLCFSALRSYQIKKNIVVPVCYVTIHYHTIHANYRGMWQGASGKGGGS